jgi:hypothetical protein
MTVAIAGKTRRPERAEREGIGYKEAGEGGDRGHCRADADRGLAAPEGANGGSLRERLEYFSRDKPFGFVSADSGT